MENYNCSSSKRQNPAAFDLSRLAYTVFRAAGPGNIINVSFVAGLSTLPQRAFYGASKAAVQPHVVVFFFELGLSAYGLEQVFYLFGIVPARFTHPDWAVSVGFPAESYLSLLTHQFLHGGWLHIISNMWTLWIFGDNVEDRMGPVRFAIFYLACGVLAALTHVLSSPNSTVPSVGASGAIAGVLGAYFLLFPTARLVVMFPVLFFPFFFEVPAVFYLGVWFSIQLFSGALALAGPEEVGGIAWWAHIGGFLAGMLLCGVFCAAAGPAADATR